MRPILDYIYGHNIVLCVCEGWGGGACAPFIPPKFHPPSAEEEMIVVLNWLLTNFVLNFDVNLSM